MVWVVMKVESVLTTTFPAREILRTINVTHRNIEIGTQLEYRE